MTAVADVFSGSADKSLQVLDVETGAILYSQPNAHKYAAMKLK